MRESYLQSFGSRLSPPSEIWRKERFYPFLDFVMLYLLSFGIFIESWPHCYLSVRIFWNFPGISSHFLGVFFAPNRNLTFSGRHFDDSISEVYTYFFYMNVVYLDHKKEIYKYQVVWRGGTWFKKWISAHSLFCPANFLFKIPLSAGKMPKYHYIWAGNHF